MMPDPTINKIPRNIWILWLAGPPDAPFVVQRCIESWKRHNPDWKIHLLNANKLEEFIELKLSAKQLRKIGPVKQSNLIRLQVLEKYGGVWADATTYCMRPLDSWIDYHAASGFFVFHRPDVDRILSNWFIAAQPGNVVVTKMLERYIEFFTKNNYRSDGPIKQRIINRVHKHLRLNRSEKTARLWFSPIFTRVLRVYPYHIFHYMFEMLVSSDPECQQIWAKMPKISAKDPHKIQDADMLGPLNESIKSEIDSGYTPLYKLRHQYDPQLYDSSSILHYLLERSQ